MLWPYSGLAFCSNLIRFLLFRLTAAEEFDDFFFSGVWQLATGGNSLSFSSISSAARVLEVFLPLPSPSVTKSPTMHLSMEYKLLLRPCSHLNDFLSKMSQQLVFCGKGRPSWEKVFLSSGDQTQIKYSPSLESSHVRRPGLTSHFKLHCHIPF